MEARSRIDQIQLLGHNFMIPKEVEIWLGDLPMASDDPELSKAMFYCLGVVSTKHRQFNQKSFANQQ